MSAIYSSALLGSQVNLIQTAPCRASFRPNSKSVLCSRRKLVCKAEESAPEAPTEAEETATKIQLDKDITKFARNAATTFAPRASGSVLYKIFEIQAWLSLAVGGLLSFNLIFPSDQPDIARLIGMWSIWMFTVPSLRARECTAPEKDALNLLFLAIPLLNVGLPFIWKSFPFIYVADCVTMFGVYAWKGLLPVGGQSGSEEEQK
ncbi:putative Protein RESISTANCE TO PHYTOPHTHORA 1, chloroplastic [Nannochloris sp. 'desiccata']|nr:hypothetical protein KSW81_002596 [Chlorella desiccata (nom. nud.)]KAH7617343.1 putative Protein RESISTANCE TO PHYTOPHTHORA 1, chloroplastic [Chlorella desiccata (nom. nud.)]